MNWKAARSRLPPSRALWTFLTRTRFWLLLVIAGLFLMIWNGVRGTAGEMQK